MASAQGLSLEFSDRRPVPYTLEGVNEELLKIGAGIDEMFQMLSGGGFVIHQRLDDGETLTLTLGGPGENSGWLATSSGVRPHIGSLSSASVGSKLLVQAFGAPEWRLTYADEAVP